MQEQVNKPKTRKSRVQQIRDEQEQTQVQGVAVEEIAEQETRPEPLRRASQPANNQIEGTILKARTTRDYSPYDAPTVNLPSSSMPERKTLDYDIYPDNYNPKGNSTARRYPTTDQTKAVQRNPRYPIPRRENPKATIHLKEPIHFTSGFWLIVAGCFILAVLLIAFILPPLVTKWHNDQIYGTPRTYQVNKNVGHAGTSHFIAVNLQGKIEVIEIPTNHQQTKIYDVTQLAGNGADLYPVTLEFGTGQKPFMEVIVNNTIYLYTNNGTSFTASH